MARSTDVTAPVASRVSRTLPTTGLPRTTPDTEKTSEEVLVIRLKVSTAGTLVSADT
jgi:hypothetical protein